MEEKHKIQVCTSMLWMSRSRQPGQLIGVTNSGQNRNHPIGRHNPHGTCAKFPPNFTFADWRIFPSFL